MIDDTTRQILKLIEKDGRLESRQIAAMLGLSVDDVERRIGEAEAAGILVRYKALIDWEKAGDDYVLALIEVKVSPQRETGFDAIAERIYRFPEARSVYLVSGTYDLAVQVVGRTMKDVANFVAEKLAPLDGVQGTVTHFILRRYKEDGEVLAQHEQARRLPITP